MGSEIANILVSESPVVLPYSGFWPNALTVVWGCIFLSILIIFLTFLESRPTSLKTILIGLIGFGLLMALAVWGAACVIFVPKDTVLLRPPPLCGTLITFLILATFVFLTLRKKNYPFLVKLGLVLFVVDVPLCAGLNAQLSTHLLSQPWLILQHMLYLYFFFLLVCETCCSLVALAAWSYENQRLEGEIQQREEPIQRQNEENRELEKQIQALAEEPA